MVVQYSELRPTSSWDLLASLRHPCKFQCVSRLGSVTARQSSNGHQPNFVALNIGCHLYSAGRPSRWAFAHILVDFCFLSTSQEIGWGEYLWNDLFYVEWDVKPPLSQWILLHSQQHQNTEANAKRCCEPMKIIQWPASFFDLSLHCWGKRHSSLAFAPNIGTLFAVFITVLKSCKLETKDEKWNKNNYETVMNR